MSLVTLYTGCYKPMKNSNIVYTALFVSDTLGLTKLFEPVHKNVIAHHSTIAFQPNNLEGIEVGKAQRLKIIGRVVDGKADALLVENKKSANEYPHITMSTVKGVPAVYSNEMIANAAKEHLLDLFNEPTYIDVIEGYFDGESKIITK